MREIAKLLTVTLMGFTAALFAANPYELPEYRREITIRFATPEAAERAKLEFLPLPEGKSVAFSTRWDDSNPRHDKMAELLTSLGYKATFYLCNTKEQFYRETLPLLTQGGHSVGNHTWSHPNLALLVPNRVFQEIMENRVHYESRTGQPVTAFVLPYCAYKNGSDKECPLRIGDALRRSGQLGSPEYFPDLEKEYGLPEKSWAVSSLFSIDDSNPKPKQLDNAVANRLKGQQPGEIRHMTLGLHTWQSDAGFKTLGEALGKYADRPEWWYCNENEYIAYRYMYHHARVIGKRVEGDSAVFTLELPEPAGIGSDTPLWAKVTPAAADGKTMLPLSHLPDMMPERIDRVDNDKNQPYSRETFASTKFPGLSAGLVYDPAAGKVTCNLDNRTGHTLSEIRTVLRLPMLYETGVIALPEQQKLSSGSSCDSIIPLGKHRSEPLYQAGPLYFAAQIDFKLDGKPQRLWVSCKLELPAVPGRTTRDTALLYGPYLSSDEEEARLAAESVPTMKLSSDWRRPAEDPELLPSVIRFKFDDPELQKAAMQAKGVKGMCIAVTTTFRAEQSGERRLHVYRTGIKALYVNGKSFPVKPLPETIPVLAGENRIIVVYAWNKQTKGEAMIAATIGDDPNL